MRTTLDLPDELLRRAKARAALSGLKLKELIAWYIELGLRQTEAVPTAGRPPRSPLPTISKAASGQPIPALSNAELEAILAEEDAEQARRSSGR